MFNMKKLSIFFISLVLVEFTSPAINLYAESKEEKKEIQLTEVKNALEKSNISSDRKAKMLDDIKEFEEELKHYDNELVNLDISAKENKAIEEIIEIDPVKDEISVDTDDDNYQKLDDKIITEVETYVEQTQEQIDDGDFYINNSGEVEAATINGDYIPQLFGIEISKTTRGYKLTIDKAMVKKIMKFGAGVFVGLCLKFTSGIAYALCAQSYVVIRRYEKRARNIEINFDKRKKSIRVKLI